MKKKTVNVLLASVVVLSTIGLTACGSAGDVARQLSAQITQSEPASIHGDPNTAGDTASPNAVHTPDYIYPFEEFPEEEGSLLIPQETDGNNIFIVSGEKICYAGNLQKIAEHCGFEISENGWISAAVYDRGAIVSKYFYYEKDKYKESVIALYPREGIYTEIADFNNSVNIAFYDNQLIITENLYNSNSGKTDYSEYIYSRDADSPYYDYVGQPDKSFCDYISDKYSLFYSTTGPNNSSVKSIHELLDTVGFVAVVEDSRYLKLYADLHTEYLAEFSYDTNLTAYDANFAVITHNDSMNEIYLEIIDTNNHTSNIAARDYYSNLAYQNGCVYYAMQDNKADGINYNIYLYNCYEKCAIPLYSTNHVAGVTNKYTPGISSFNIINGQIYTINYNGETTSWFCANGSEDGYSFNDTGYELIRYQWHDLGDISYRSTVDYCTYCGIVNYTYYSEVFEVSDSISCNDKINRKLTELENEQSSCFAPDTYFNSEEYCNDTHNNYGITIPGTTVEFYIDNVKLLSSHFLAIYKNGYVYSGGAHGYPYCEQYLFDLNTGDYIELKNIYTGSEEHLKDVVATAAKNDFTEQMNKYGYSPYFGESAKEVYMAAYDITSPDTLLGMFEEDGFHVLFAPYEMGPFVSGYIETIVSYADLGITLFD